MSDNLVPVFVPPLRALLAESERRAGRPLTKADVESIGNHAAYLMLTKSEAERMIAARGYADFDRDKLWEEWQAARDEVSDIPRDAAAVRRPFELPSDPQGRHEALGDLFGRHLFVMRNRVMRRLTEIVEAPQQERNKMGKLHREEFDAVAALDEHGRKAALGLAGKAIESMMQATLALFSASGASVEMSLDDERTIAYDVTMKILSRQSLEPLEHHTVNRDGKKPLVACYGRWLNRYKDCIEFNA